MYNTQEIIHSMEFIKIYQRIGVYNENMYSLTIYSFTVFYHGDLYFTHTANDIVNLVDNIKMAIYKARTLQ